MPNATQAIDIVFEGPDGGGKSTLIEYVARMRKLPVVPGEGPPKYPGEMDIRLRRMLQRTMSGLFDRHPAISEPIYGSLRGSTLPSATLIRQFYERHPFIVYCRPRNLDDALKSHVLGKYDTEDHLDLIAQHYPRIVSMYDEWALDHANYIYRIGDDMNRVVLAIP